MHKKNQVQTFYVSMPEARFPINAAGMMWIGQELLDSIIDHISRSFTDAELHVTLKDSSNSRMHRIGVVNRERMLTSRCVLQSCERSRVVASLVALEDSVYNSHYIYEPAETSLELVLRKRDASSVQLEEFPIN